MKKNLALILALAMLASTLLSVVPMAEGEEIAPEVTPEAAPVSTYNSPEVAYANLNYVGNISMMFAVPVYEDLPEGAEVKLIVWNEYNSSYAFSYSEAVSETSAPVAIALDAEEQRATIADREHFVFKYAGLSAEMMTDVVYVRPVVLLADGGRRYGDVMTYSILEYVKSVKGEMDGISGVEDEKVLESLDAMLDFGAMAQEYSGEEDGYLPNGFLANEEVNKIWITPVIDGVAGERVFAGFFKAGADFASIYPLAEDLYRVDSIVGSDGEALSDDDADLSGIQISAPEEGDLEITMNMSVKTIFDSTIENADLGWYLDNKGTSVFDQAKAGQRVEMPSAHLAGNSGTGPAQGKRNFSAFYVIEDPINPESGDKVLRWSGVQNSALYFEGKNTPIAIRNGAQGFCDTIDPVVTVELVIAANALSTITTANFRIRSDFKNLEGASKQCNLNVMKIEKNVVKIGVSEGSYVDLCTLSNDKYTKIAFTIDFANETIKAYWAYEGEAYQKVVDSSLGRPSIFPTAVECGHTGYTSLLDWFLNAQAKIEWYGGNAAGGISSDSALKTLKADMDGDGVAETPLSPTGSLDDLNQEAYAQWFFDNRSLLVKDARMFVGGIE